MPSEIFRISAGNHLEVAQFNSIEVIEETDEIPRDSKLVTIIVEDGKIVSPIEDMRFDDTIYNFFGEKLESVTDKSRLNPSVGTYGGRDLRGVHCPGIILSSFELTL